MLHGLKSCFQGKINERGRTKYLVFLAPSSLNVDFSAALVVNGWESRSNWFSKETLEEKALYQAVMCDKFSGVQ